MVGVPEPEGPVRSAVGQGPQLTEYRAILKKGGTVLADWEEWVGRLYANSGRCEIRPAEAAERDRWRSGRGGAGPHPPRDVGRAPRDDECVRSRPGKVHSEPVACAQGSIAVPICEGEVPVVGAVAERTDSSVSPGVQFQERGILSERTREGSGRHIDDVSPWGGRLLSKCDSHGLPPAAKADLLPMPEHEEHEIPRVPPVHGESVARGQAAVRVQVREGEQPVGPTVRQRVEHSGTGIVN